MQKPAPRDSLGMFGELSPAKIDTEDRGDESDLLGPGVCLAHHFQLSRGVSWFMAFQSGFFCASSLGQNRINYFSHDCERQIAAFPLVPYCYT
jgi:hypothetical protein